MSHEAPNGADARLAARLLGIDPAGLKGAVLQGRAGPAREAWMKWFAAPLGADAPLRRAPPQASSESLRGGLDLAATLRAGKPVLSRGLFASAEGGALVLPMAERMSALVASEICDALDRDAGLAVVALDESLPDEEPPPPALLERLAFRLSLDGLRVDERDGEHVSAEDAAMVRARAKQIPASEAALEALCGAAAACGVFSLRAPILGLRVARLLAALDDARALRDEDVLAAARLVIAPRATMAPAPDEMDQPPDAPEPRQDKKESEEFSDDNSDAPLADRVLDAVRAAVPPDLMAKLLGDGTRASRRANTGKSGAASRSLQRGRPIGSRPGDWRGGARLSLIDTLRAAAPWQTVRGATRDENGFKRLAIRREDIRIKRFEQRAESATIFVVDASGSSALARMAEAKGAVESLLADCYVRRDQVALIAFRGAGAEILLPPTRSLARAKRSLAALPGGGGTPLAAGVDAAVVMAEQLARRGQTPTLIFLTDGRANIARDGKGGRTAATEDAFAAARAARATGVAAAVIDTSPQPHPAAQRFASEMRALYAPLPFADAAAVSAAVRGALR